MSVAAPFSRRRLLHGFACGCLAAGALSAGPLVAPALLGAARAADPVPKTTLSADQALARLKEGNEAFVKGGACVPTGGPARVAELARGQAPFAVIVACSDSRTPPEHIFGGGLGEIFIIRVAGNTVDDVALGSIEYGVAVLGAPLVLVLGHSACGAVKAAVDMVENATDLPGSINAVVEPILPAVLRAKKAGGDVVTASIRENVALTLLHAEQSSTILAEGRKSGRVRMEGGVYDLATGKVELLS